MNTTIGYRRPDSICFGGRSHPCTRHPSLTHSRFSARPQDGLSPALLRVTGFHSPIGPAHTSGGSVNELRMMALVLPSLASAKDGSTPPAWTPYSPRHSVSLAPLDTSSVETALPPPIHSVKSSRPGDIQRTEPGDDFRPGVWFAAAPPPAATV